MFSFKVKKKLNFLFELFMQIEKYNSSQPSDIKIEIFGRSYKTKPTQNLDLADIKAGLLRVGKLPDYVRKYNVKFIGLDDRSQKREGKIGFHERFFYTDKFIFEIENSFEVIPGKTQILKFALQQEREDLFQRFNDKGKHYDLVFTR